MRTSQTARACGFTLALLARGAFVAAQPRPAPRVRFAYTLGEHTEACPGEASVRAAVVTRLGYDPFDDRAEGSVEATIRRDGRGLRASVRRIDRTGRATGARRIASRRNDCGEIAEAMSLTISIVIDPLRAIQAATASPETTPDAPVDPPTEPQGAGEPNDAAAPSRAPVVATEPPAAARARRPSRAAPQSGRSAGLELRAGASVAAGLGLTPGPSLGPAIHLALRRGRVSLGAEARVEWARSLAFGRGTIDVVPITATLVPCVHLPSTALCGLATAGWVHAAGHGYAIDQRADVPLVGIGVRGALEWPRLGPVTFRTNVDLQYLAVRPRLAVLDAASEQQAWVVWPVALSLGIGAWVHWP